MSTISDSLRQAQDDAWAAGDPPEWLGDVTVGVDAWTKRAGSPRQARRTFAKPVEAPTESFAEPVGGLTQTDAEPVEAPTESFAEPVGGLTQTHAEPVEAPTESFAEPVEAPAEPVDEVVRGPEADPESVARKILLDQLTGQARSRKELADKLAKKLVPQEIAERLLDRFEEVGLIDDAAFARLWIDSRQSGKGLARRALAQELRRKGIADEVAREALDEVAPEDEEATARALVAKKLRSLARFDDVTKTRRLVGMLARKGYPPGLAMSVVREAVRADGSEDEMPQSLT